MAAAAAAAAAASATPNAEHVRQLTDMGFPEDQATAALRAAMGNPDVAVEFLMTGIPDNVQVRQRSASTNLQQYSILVGVSLLDLRIQQYISSGTFRIRRIVWLL